MFKEAKANIAAAIILAVLVVGGLLGFIFLYDFPEYYKVDIQNPSKEGFEIVAVEGCNSEKIKEGTDFKFKVTLTEEYADSVITVEVNGVEVSTYESFGYYVVKDVQRDVKIYVKGLQRSQ